jgi:hypothetical protein
LLQSSLATKLNYTLERKEEKDVKNEVTTQSRGRSRKGAIICLKKV